MDWEIILFPAKGQTHTLLNLPPLPAFSCRCTYSPAWSAHSAFAEQHSQNAWPTGQLVSYRLGRVAVSLCFEPVVPALWEAKSLMYHYLFSFNTQLSLDSATHQWSALTSAQILFGVLVFKKITYLTLETDLISWKHYIDFFSALLIFAAITNLQYKSSSLEQVLSYNVVEYNWLRSTFQPFNYSQIYLSSISVKSLLGFLLSSHSVGLWALEEHDRKELGTKPGAEWWIGPILTYTQHSKSWTLTSLSAADQTVTGPSCPPCFCARRCYSHGGVREAHMPTTSEC